ncbi:MAG: NUDIX hydrolase [Pseudomonadota bacterium]
MGEIWKPHVAAAAIVERGGEYLFVEEIADGELVLNQPAGHLDPGETLIEACVRETQEETGWRVGVDALIGIYLLETETPGETFLRFCFAATPLEHDPDQRLDDEIQRIVWLNREHAQQRRAMHRSPLVMRSIEDFENGARYPLSLLDAYLNNQ